jgi:predicted ATP-grasp superfamily ATP-dependent carboligase
VGVIVLGGHIQAYGIVRGFAEKGVDCVLIDSRNANIARHSKYCSSFYRASYRHTLKLLQGFMRQNKYPNWVIYPTDDHYVRLLSENKELLSRHFTHRKGFF